MELLFDRDPLTGTIQKFHYSDDDKVTITDTQDVTAIIEQNKALQNSGVQHSRKSGLRRVASIPLNILFELKKKWRDQGLSWEERQVELHRWLNDKDNLAFRTDNTRI